VLELGCQCKACFSFCTSAANFSGLYDNMPCQALQVTSQGLCLSSVCRRKQQQPLPGWQGCWAWRSILCTLVHSKVTCSLQQPKRLQGSIASVFQCLELLTVPLSCLRSQRASLNRHVTVVGTDLHGRLMQRSCREYRTLNVIWGSMPAVDSQRFHISKQQGRSHLLSRFAFCLAASAALKHPTQWIKSLVLDPIIGLSTG
jgi:hypothetical protein